LLGPSTMLSGVMSLAGGVIGNFSALECSVGVGAVADAADVEAARKKYEGSEGSGPGAWSTVCSLLRTGSRKSSAMLLAWSIPSPCVEVACKMWVVEVSGASAESDGRRRI
jgi:hypothetical protein